jgi:hypothetical protein
MIDTPYICRRASGPIAIDGHPDEPAWSRAGAIGFILPESFGEPISSTEARVLWDDSFLYVSYVASDQDIWSLFTERDSQTCREDCLECFLQPDPRVRDYYNFEINALGTVYDAYSLSRFAGGPGCHRWAAWDCDGLRVGVSIDGTLNDPHDMDRCWRMEIAVPFASLPSLKGRSPVPGDTWRFLLSRYDYSVHLPDGVELSSSSRLTKVDFHDCSEWGELLFSD